MLSHAFYISCVFYLVCPLVWDSTLRGRAKHSCHSSTWCESDFNLLLNAFFWSNQTNKRKQTKAVFGFVIVSIIIPETTWSDITRPSPFLCPHKIEMLFFPNTLRKQELTELCRLNRNIIKKNMEFYSFILQDVRNKLQSYKLGIK